VIDFEKIPHTGTAQKFFPIYDGHGNSVETMKRNGNDSEESVKVIVGTS
jgi:hypothetical protein